MSSMGDQRSPKRLLVTGGTGLLGKGILETVPQGWRVIVVHRRDYLIGNARCEILRCDLTDRSMVQELFRTRQVDAVVHAGGIADVDYVERHAAESRVANVGGTENVLRACRDYGLPVVFVSSNAVFDGTRAPYRESDPVCPVNAYGRQKVECEQLVQDQLDAWTIVRPIVMYGTPYAQGRSNPAVWVRERLARGEPVRLVTDVHENPLLNVECARVVWALVERELHGIFHIGGADRVNRYEFGLAVATTFDLNSALIHPVTSSAFPDIAPRPLDTTFSLEKMSAILTISPKRLLDGLATLRIVSGGACR